MFSFFKRKKRQEPQVQPVQTPEISSEMAQTQILSTETPTNTATVNTEESFEIDFEAEQKTTEACSTLDNNLVETTAQSSNDQNHPINENTSSPIKSNHEDHHSLKTDNNDNKSAPIEETTTVEAIVANPTIADILIVENEPNNQDIIESVQVDEFEINETFLKTAATPPPINDPVSPELNIEIENNNDAAIEAAVKAMQQASGMEIFDFSHQNGASEDALQFYDDNEEEVPETLILQDDTETVDAQTIEAQMLAMEEAVGRQQPFGDKLTNRPSLNEIINLEEDNLPKEKLFDTQIAPIEEIELPINDTKAIESSPIENIQLDTEEIIIQNETAPIETATRNTIEDAQPSNPHILTNDEKLEPIQIQEYIDIEPNEDISQQNDSHNEKLGWAARLKQGLSKSRNQMAKSLATVFGGGKIDDDLYEELETVLITSDMGIEATEKLMEEVRHRVSLRGLSDGAQLRQTLKDAVYDLLKPLEKPLIIPENTHKPFVIMMVGINGAGKTTSIGKLAKYFQSQGKSVILAAGDTFRAAAREQLQEWGRKNDVTVISQASGDSAAVCFDAVEAAKARKIDIVLADTAGRLPTQLHLMEEIKKVKRVLQKSIPDAPHEIIVVLDANIGQNALNQVEAFHNALDITGLIVTKLDGTAKGGVVAALASNYNIPIRYIGVGEKIDDLRPFDTRSFVDALMDEH